MKICAVGDLIESGKYTMKRNPWKAYGDLPHVNASDCIITKVPPWAKARYGKDARPEGVKAVNDVAGYIMDKMDGIHPKYRTWIYKRVMETVSERAQAGNPPGSTADLDSVYNDAFNACANAFNISTSALQDSGRKKELVRERRQQTTPALKKLARAIPG